MIHKMLFLLCCFGFVACYTPGSSGENKSGDTLTVYLVRHAEKTSGDDPALTAEGHARAERLAEMLADENVDAVFSTDFQRTRQTAEPTAQAHDLSVQFYDPTDLNGFAKQLKKQYQGQTVLVVGHSNTTPTLAGLLDGTKAHAPFDESDYGNIMVVTIPKKGEPEIEKRRY